MPEDNQKPWTKLFKRQRRTTWAVLGVALVALLLAVWWAPTLAIGPQVSFSPDEDDENGKNGESSVSDISHIEIIRLTATEHIDGLFDIDIRCDESYQVKAIYVDVDDSDYDISVEFFKVFIQKHFGAAGLETWDIDHEDYTVSDRGVELLSFMKLEKPLGVPEGFTFVIGGDVDHTFAYNDDVLTVTAVLETAGTCQLRIDN